MLPKHESLNNLWDEWYGINAFHDQEGGVAGRDKKYGKKWRKGVVSPHHYSRTSRTIAGIANHATSHQIKEEESVALLEAAFLEAKCSVSNFVKKLQEMGLVQVRNPRTRQAQKE